MPRVLAWTVEGCLGIRLRPFVTSWHCLALSGSVCGFSALPLVVCVCVCERVVHARSDKSQVHLGFQKKGRHVSKEAERNSNIHEGSISAKFVSRGNPERFERAPGWPQGAPWSPKGPLGGPKETQRSPKRTQRGAKGVPKEPKRTQRSPKGAPKEPQRSPKWTQNAAKMAPWGHLGDPNGDKKLLRLQNDTKMRPKTDPKVALLSTSLASYFE